MAAARRYDAITDVPGIRVGHWTDRRAATGCTVVLCEAGAVPGVDVRGAAPGTFLSDYLRPGTAATLVNAVVLTGGGIFGLESISGVLRWCEERGLGPQFGGRAVPIVAGAVIFDLNLGRADVRPDAASGYAAAAAAKGGRVAEGCVGAGTGARVASLLGPERGVKGGIGSASEAVGDGLIVGAIIVVNAVGEVVDSRDGRVVAGPRAQPGAFADALTTLRQGTPRLREGNTTIGVVATNAGLTKEQAGRLATVAHDGLARAVRPAHTMGDGDTIFAMATGERPLGDRVLALEAFAALAVERAIVKAVLAATSLAGVPSASDWQRRGEGQT